MLAENLMTRLKGQLLAAASVIHFFYKSVPNIQ